MAFEEEIEVKLVTKSYVVEHISGVQLEITTDKLIDHKEINPSVYRHTLELSFDAAEDLYIRLGQSIKIAKELVDENRAIIKK